MDTQPTPGHNQPAMTSPTNTMNMNASQPGNTPPPHSGNPLLANKKLLYGLIAAIAAPKTVYSSHFLAVRRSIPSHLQTTAKNS